ncbi:MAG: hypothetical protein M9927_17225 [Anaerolineae bacterium]|nr:hypothetical protein [Anaerolineae bacterium]
MRLTTLRAGVSSPYTNLQNLSYTYDAVGNVASIVDGVNSSQRQCFGYDALDRLTNAFTGNSGCTAYTTGGTGPYNHTYVYDAVGNLTSYAGNAYTYGDSSHKHAVTSAYGNSYGYDGNGNQTSRTIGGVVYTFVFDYENRLTEVKQGTTTLATFLYDADGNRVKGTVNGTATVYIAGIYEYQGGATTKYYEGGGLRRAGYSTNNGVFYMLSDHLKSTSALVARNGVLNVKYFYYPYGARRGVPFNTITARHFTGQYHETALPGGEGLSYYGARWYDPRLGRFLSADTIVPNASNPQDLNRFAYVRNNPLRYVDPSGHMLCEGAVSCSGGSSSSGGSSTGGTGTSTSSWTPAAPVYGPSPRPASTSTPKPNHQSPSVPATTQAPTQQTSEPPWGPSQSPDDDWVDLGFDWLLQHGPEIRYFGEGDYMVEELKRHHGVIAAREAALVVDYPPGVPFPYHHDFGPDGYELAWREMDGTGHFLGTYDVFITDNGGGTATVRVENQSDWASFTNLRSFPVDISLVEVMAANQKPFIDGKPQFRTILPDIPRDQTFGYGGNYLQIYEWQEPWP